MCNNNLNLDSEATVAALREYELIKTKEQLNNHDINRLCSIADLLPFLEKEIYNMMIQMIRSTQYIPSNGPLSGYAMKSLSTSNFSFNGYSFKNLQVPESNFINSNLSNGEFTGSDFRGSIFTQSTLINTDLSNCNLLRIKIENHKPRLEYYAHSNPLCMSKTGDFILSSHADTEIRMREIESGKTLKVFRDHFPSAIYSLSLDPSHEIIAGLIGSKILKIISLKNNQLLHTIESNPSSLFVVRFFPDGKRLAAGTSSSEIYIWNLETLKLETVLNGHTDWVFSIDISSNGQFLVSGSYDTTIKLWNREHEITSLEKHSNCVLQVKFSDDCKLIASSSKDRRVVVWNNCIEIACCLLPNSKRWASSIAFLPNNTQLAMGSYNGIISVWDFVQDIFVYQFRGHLTEIQGIAVTADQRYLVSSSTDKRTSCWKIKGKNNNLTHNILLWKFYMN